MPTVYRRLTEHHPLSQALFEIFAKMDELGVKISLEEYGRVSVHYKDEVFTMLDVESSPHSDDYAIGSFPPDFDYKLIF